MYPQCLSCSLTQGGSTWGLMRSQRRGLEGKANFNSGNALGYSAMNSIKIAPANSMIFISDKTAQVAPEITRDRSIWWTRECVAVGCLPFMDGETEIVMGLSHLVDPGGKPAFDQMIRTPSGLITVSMVAEETGLEQPVQSDLTRVRIWTNDPRMPDRVIIGIN